MKYSIYSSAGVLKTDFSPSANSTWSHKTMTENVLNLTFALNEYVALDVNDYIDIGTTRFKLIEPYKPTQKNKMHYEYNVKFYGMESQLKNIMCLKLVDASYESEYSLTDSPISHVQLIVDNINRIEGGDVWTVGDVIAGENKVVEYKNLKCFDALNTLVDAYETEWWIEGKTIHFCKCEQGTAVSLAYGAGLIDIDKEINNDTAFFTRLIPLGSTKNIVSSTYGFSRLQLPAGAKWVDKNTDLYGIIETTEEDTFADIFHCLLYTI